MNLNIKYLINNLVVVVVKDDIRAVQEHVTTAILKAVQCAQDQCQEKQE